MPKYTSFAHAEENTAKHIQLSMHSLILLPTIQPLTSVTHYYPILRWKNLNNLIHSSVKRSMGITIFTQMQANSNLRQPSKKYVLDMGNYKCVIMSLTTFLQAS